MNGCTDVLLEQQFAGFLHNLVMKSDLIFTKVIRLKMLSLLIFVKTRKLQTVSPTLSCDCTYIECFSCNVV